MSEEEIPKDLPKLKTRHIAIIALLFVVLLGALFFTGYFPHRKRIAQANAIAAEQDDRPMVDIVQPKRADTGGTLMLPGDARAMKETLIYPRATGYLKKLAVDIGDRVKEGQVLAEIDAPEIDAQLNEAKAAVVQSKAMVTKSQTDLEFAQTTFTRYDNLSKNEGISPQELDEKRVALNQARTAVDAAKANLTAADAAVQRLTQLQSFEKVTAPFAGVITSRGYDVGALLSANSTGKEMFRLEQTDTLRVLVDIPQTYATAIKIGDPATLEVRTSPGKLFKGKVARSAGALNSDTRTLRAEVWFPNSDNSLIAGMYGQVQFQLQQEQPPLLVPTGAMMFDTDGTRVAVIENNKVRFQKIRVGRDLGSELEVVEGLDGTEQVVANPGERLADGVEVQITQPKNADQKNADNSQQTRTQTAAK